MTAQNEGYKIMPPMDPKYTERSGLEGPFTTLSGKVVYYDPKEGSYYDPDTDMYMSYDEFQNYDKDYSGMKDERDDVKAVEEKVAENYQDRYDAVAKTQNAIKMGRSNATMPQSAVRKVSGNPNYSHKDNPFYQAKANARKNDGLGKNADIIKKMKPNPTDGKFIWGRDKLSDDVKEAGGYYTQPVYDMIEKHGYEKVMHELLTSLHADAIQSFLQRANFDEAITAQPLSPEDKALVNKMYNKDGTLTDLGKRVMSTKESRTLENLITKVFDNAVNEFEFNPNAGHRDQLSHPENRGLGGGSGLAPATSPRPKLRPKNLKAPMSSPRPKARPKDLEMKFAINKAVQQAVGEGDGRKKGIHPKGHPMRQKQQAAIHANESTSKPEVSVNEMKNALKLKDVPSNEHVVASYVQTMIDESHKTWDDVMEQVEYVLGLVKEGKTMEAHDVFNIVKAQHMQKHIDYKMSLSENVDTLRNIVKDKAYRTVKFDDGSMKVDLTTASMFLQVVDAQKPETQEKIQAKIKTKQGFLAMLDLIYSKV